MEVLFLDLDYYALKGKILVLGMETHRYFALL